MNQMKAYVTNNLLSFLSYNCSLYYYRTLLHNYIAKYTYTSTCMCHISYV